MVTWIDKYKHGLCLDGQVGRIARKLLFFVIKVVIRMSVGVLHHGRRQTQLTCHFVVNFLGYFCNYLVLFQIVSDNKNRMSLTGHIEADICLVSVGPPTCTFGARVRLAGQQLDGYQSRYALLLAFHIRIFQGQDVWL